jgi:hypothetical protein
MAVTLGEVKPFIQQAQLGQNIVAGQVQSQIQAATQGPTQGAPAGTQDIQNLAAGVAQAQGQAAVQAQVGAAKQAQIQESQKQQTQKLERARKIQEQRQNNTVEARKSEERLASSNALAKQEIFDSAMQFKKDELGRTLFNERQLADWAVSKAKNEEELAEYEQIAHQALERKQLVFDQAWKVLEQDLQYAWQKAEQEKDYALKEKLAKMKQAYERKKEQMEAEAAAAGSLFAVGGTIVGTAVGAYFGGPGGAVAGGTIGGGLGKMAYSKTR